MLSHCWQRVYFASLHELPSVGCVGWLLWLPCATQTAKGFESHNGFPMDRDRLYTRTIGSHGRKDSFLDNYNIKLNEYIL
jgi:hypothetical protein